jgi:transposase-like protein
MAEEMAGGVQTVDDLREVMRMMSKTLMEKALDVEMDVHLGRKKVTGCSVTEEGAAAASPPAARESSAGRKNRRNGRSAKTVQGELGEVTIATPRDRAGSFEPQLVPKYQRRMPGFDEKVLALYVAIGVNLEGHKDLLGLWLAENEGAKFWLSVLTDMKNRGLNDIFVACIDGLTGFPDAIRTVFEDAKVQLCVVHLVRAALRYVAGKDGKAVAGDLKKMVLHAF